MNHLHLFINHLGLSPILCHIEKPKRVIGSVAQPKDLDHRYEKISPFFRILNGISKPTLKQMALAASEKLCEQQQFLRAFLPYDDDTADLESLFSEQSDKDEDTSFVIRYSDGHYIDPGSNTCSGDSLPLKAEDVSALVPILSLQSKYVSPINVLGSQLPDKDILVSMDTYAKGAVSPSLLKSYVDSHDQFDHPTSLWKNSKLFIHLSFKMNEDINPMKATHLGMSLPDLNITR
ncbi:hypothetical protein FNV43_RR27294 [Rhamnella rubrinervis]|uniref:Uncharacterized protein n=1 Tax=Rhamnella rubrinervis TaxID=2594499 RepID=A0A8K0DQS4_9ROSA|nr:hypothetical protein FNV43_RR27294 [Rhamnella rubrinervis]